MAAAATGCGGSASTSAAGHTASATVQATTNGHGGVLGAQANVGSAQLRVQANNVLQRVSKIVARMSGVHSTKQLAQASKSAQQQVQQSIAQLGKLNLSSSQAQQDRQQLKNALQKLSSNLGTIHQDAASGNLTKAINDAAHMNGLTAVQGAVRNIVSSSNQQTLQGLAASIAAHVQQRVTNIRSLNSQQGLTNAISQLQAYVRRSRQNVAGTNVPQSQQQHKQQLLTFLQQWQTDLQSAKQHAQQGQLAQAKKMAVGLSLQDLQSLITKLQGTTTTSSTPTATTSTSSTG